MNLEKSRLFRLLTTLSTREQTQFDRFLCSPYFNQREDVIRLWHWWRSKENDAPYSKETIWQQIYPDKDWHTGQFRLVMSYLTKLVEKFLAAESLLEDDFRLKMVLAQRWREQRQPELQRDSLRDAQKLLNKQAHRNADFFLNEYEWQLEWYRQAYARQPDKAVDIQSLGDSFERAIAAKKLQQDCLLQAHDQIYQLNYQPGKLNTFFQELTTDELPDDPIIRLYWHCSRMLREPNNEVHFEYFKDLLVAQGDQLPPEEARDLHLLAINHGIRRVNEGARRYFQDVMDLYRAGLEQTYLLRNGLLSRFTYHNIVAVALQIDDSAWAKEFIEDWTSSLERRFRERMYNYSRAKIAYVEQAYEEALSFLQQSNYHDPLLNLGARALLLKIYYELDEWDALQSHLDAFQNYLRRRAGLGYHRANYRNLIRYTRKLLRLQPRDQLTRERLQMQIEAEDLLTEKDWLLKQLLL